MTPLNNSTAPAFASSTSITSSAYSPVISGITSSGSSISSISGAQAASGDTVRIFNDKSHLTPPVSPLTSQDLAAIAADYKNQVED